jgi:dienelactone hydrolase
MPAYKFTEADGYDPFDRSELNGFRTMRERGGDAADELRSPVDLDPIDFTVVEPLSDDAFAVYQRQFAYDNTPLNSQLESSDDSQTDWRRETVLIDAAYGGERFRVHLYLPKHGTPPFEAVVYVPGSNAFEQPQFADGYWENFDYIAKSGRVLVRPILTGSYERIDATLSFDDRIPRTVKDLGRTLDYLESRGDIQPDRIAYLGLSYGAWLSPINLAAENRFGAAVLLGGGVAYRMMIARFAPRVTTPVLMLGGRYDSTFQAETSQKRLRDLFGTPEQDKRLVLYDAGHLPLPRGESIREILEWLDRYQRE